MSLSKVHNQKNNEIDDLNENRIETSHTKNERNPDYKHETAPRYRYKEPDLTEPKIIDIDSAFDKVLVTLNGVEGRIQYIPDYISSDEADNLYEYLSKYDNIDWQQREGANQTGDIYHEPRLTFWFGKPYKYSSVQWDSNENWDSKIEDLRVRLNKEHPINDHKEYNSVMCNYYRNNIDSIGWHSDDETSLGRFPKIASISLGCKRVFEICRRKEYFFRKSFSGPRNSVFNGCTILYRFHLNTGSLLLMDESIQEEFLHRVPKENSPMEGRINLTYRYIVSEEDEKSEKERRKKNRKPYHKIENSKSNKTYYGDNQRNQFEKNDHTKRNIGNQAIMHISDWNSKYSYQKQYWEKPHYDRGQYFENEINILKNKGKRNTESNKDYNSDSYNESSQTNRNAINKNNKRNKSASVNENIAKSDYDRFNNGRNQAKNVNENKKSRNKSNTMIEKTSNHYNRSDGFKKEYQHHEKDQDCNVTFNKKETKTENKHQEKDIKGQDWSDVQDEDKVLLSPDSFIETNIQENMIENKSSSQIANDQENAAIPNNSFLENVTVKADDSCENKH